MQTQIASHRGGAFHWPENSLLAFRQALAWPADQIEFDVHMSADGEPVVFHDATLDRMTDGTGPVVAQNWDSLRRLRVRGTGGEGIPHLAAVAELIGPSAQLLRLEVKACADGTPYPGFLESCRTVLGAHITRTVLMSFEPQTVAEATGFAGRVLLVEGRAMRGMGPRGALALCHSCGAEELGVPIGVATPALRAATAGQGLRLSVWGANHAPTIQAALTLGVDALATDDPPLALALREGACPA